MACGPEVEPVELIEAEREPRMVATHRLFRVLNHWIVNPDEQRFTFIEGHTHGKEGGETRGVVELINIRKCITVSFIETTGDDGQSPLTESCFSAGVLDSPPDDVHEVSGGESLDLVTLAKIAALIHPDAAQRIDADRWSTYADRVSR